MTFVKEIKAGSREFCQNLLRYLLLFMGLSLFNQFIVIPLFRYITTFVLQASAIPFVSYQNVVFLTAKILQRLYLSKPINSSKGYLACLPGQTLKKTTLKEFKQPKTSKRKQGCQLMA